MEEKKGVNAWAPTACLALFQFPSIMIAMPTREQVIEVAKTCFDPEIPVNIWDLGLIYEIDAKETEVNIRMSLTSQHCPAAKSMPDDLKTKIKNALNVDAVVEVVFEPVWTPERISEDGKKKLGIEA